MREHLDLTESSVGCGIVSLSSSKLITSGILVTSDINHKVSQFPESLTGKDDAVDSAVNLAASLKSGLVVDLCGRIAEQSI